MKNFFKKKVTFNKFLIGIFILFFFIILGGFGKVLWEYKSLSKQNISLLSPSGIASGASALLEIRAWDIDNNNPIEEGSVKIELLDNEEKELSVLYEGDMNDGFVRAKVQLPELDEGEYGLKAMLDSKYGKDEVTKGINISSESRIFISTDRPLYKPGQTMNFRAMLLKSGDLVPIEGKEVIFEVINPKGDTVFRRNYTASKHGIVGGEFAFADELVFGEYVLRANCKGYSHEKTVTVKQFSLPKYEVKIETDQELAEKPNIISGRIEAKYFFGKPVVGAEAEVLLVLGDKEQQVTGKTDENGYAYFDFTPAYEGNVDTIRLEASVTDEGNQAVSQFKSQRITEGSVSIELIPESGKLKPGLDNNILLISSKLDGTPLKTTIFMTGEKLREFATNEYGIATFTYRPDKGSSMSRFSLNVRDEEGNALVKTFTLQNEPSSAGQIILRPKKTILSGNENLSLEILSTEDADTRLELIQSGKIIYSDVLKIVDGKASADIDLPDSLFGTVEVRATQIFYTAAGFLRDTWGTRNNRQSYIQAVSDSKFILVDRSNELVISIEKDKETYRPGEEALITFAIRGNEGAPENSALGIKIVDEALLSLAADDAFSRLLILVNEKIAEKARTVNGLEWQQVVDDETLASRDMILSAMFQDAPRETASLSEIKKDNSSAWQAFERSKRSKIMSLAILLFLGFLFLNIRFWWRLTGAVVNQKAGLRLWGGSLLVMVLGVFGFSLFVDDRYYSVWDRFMEVFEEVALGLWEFLFEYPFTWLIILILASLLSYLAWNFRAWLKAYWPLVTSYLSVAGALFLMAVLFQLDIGMDEGLWAMSLFLGFTAMLIGFSSFMVVYNLNKFEFTVASWIYVALTGILLFFVAPGIVFIYILLIIFSGLQKAIRSGDKEEANEITEKIERLRGQLAAQGRSEKEIELEIELLKRDIQDIEASTAFGRLVVVGLVTIGYIIIITLIYNIFLGFLGYNSLFVSGTSVYAQDNLLWDTPGNTGAELGLSSHDPREMIARIAMLISLLLFLVFDILMIYSGTYWLKKQKQRTLRRKYKKLLTISVSGMVIVVILTVTMLFVSGALYSATGSVGVGGSRNIDLNDANFDMDVPSLESGPEGLMWGAQEAMPSSGSLGSPSAPPILNNMLGSKKEAEEYTAPQVSENEIAIGNTSAEKDAEFKKAQRVRKFFPETMYWQSELVAENGQAQITIPVNDSITRWKLTALANSLNGKIGSAEDSLITYQDFFVDFDLPYNLTRGDELVIPVSLFNYLPNSQTIQLSIREDSWFTLLSENDRVHALGSNEVKTVDISIRIERYGDYVLHVDAEGTRSADAIEKTVSILPFGQRITQTVASEELKEDSGRYQALIPADSIAGTEKVSLKIFPSVLSEIISGLESILRFPSGCFEQTSSALYPNILVLKYLQSSGQDSPEISKKAEDFISQGVQRLLTYELEPGGFSYFGRAPSETVLSAYGLMEFSEMRGVTFVDDDLIERTKNFLYGKQKSNGSFDITGSHRGGFSGGDEIAKNAYIIWALSEADPGHNKLNRSIGYLKSNMDNLKRSPYALALAANAFINFDPSSSESRNALSELKQTIEADENRLAHIKMKKPSHYGSYGRYGNIEVTALASIAFAKAGDTEFSTKLNEYIIAYRDGRGTWGSTQATILALKSLVVNESAGQKVKDNQGSLKIVFNGQEERALEFSGQNSDVLQYLDFDSGIVSENTIEIAKEGKIRATLQIIKDYYRNWEDNTLKTAGILSIDRRYGTSRKYGPERLVGSFGVGEQVSLYVSMRSKENTKNLVAEVPIPAGFTVNTAELDCQKGMDNIQACPEQYKNGQNKLSRYENKGDRVILYFDSFLAGENVEIEIPVTPRYIGKFKMMPARFYAYYDPSKEDLSMPIDEINVGQAMLTGSVRRAAE